MTVNNALVAQLDRALDYESRGREFESSRARHFAATTIVNDRAINHASCRARSAAETVEASLPIRCVFFKRMLNIFVKVSSLSFHCTQSDQLAVLL